jgi:hypothetical protein
MKKEWMANAVFATLVSALYYLLQHGLEKSMSLTPARASAVAALVSGACVGIGLRYAVTTTPLRVWFFRKKILPAAQLEGKWLEVIQRGDERRYSLVEFEYSPSSQTDPFRMEGHAFYANSKEHSEWTTTYLKVTLVPMVSVEYIYMVTWTSESGRPAYGYGEAWYHRPGSTKPLDRGDGYYLAVEETPVDRRNYHLVRIDDTYKGLVGFDPKEDLDNHESMHKFVRCVNDYYLTNPVA